MKLFRFMLCIMGLTLMAACGIQRNLELPGHEKHSHKTQTNDEDTTDDDTDNADETAKPDAAASVPASTR